MRFKRKTIASDTQETGQRATTAERRKIINGRSEKKSNQVGWKPKVTKTHTQFNEQQEGDGT